MITETLGPATSNTAVRLVCLKLLGVSKLWERHSALEVAGLLISDSALKVVFSYYPVCRCQRTSRPAHSSTKKLNLDRYGPLC